MPVSQFAKAIPSHCMQQSKQFYEEVIGCHPLATSHHFTRYQFYHHELLVVAMGEDCQPQQHCNHVDKYDVPVPHFGIVLEEEEFHQLGKRLTSIGTKFIIEPHLRFQGQVGEQWTMFFKDPTGNNLEFKAMTNPSYLFAS